MYPTKIEIPSIFPIVKADLISDSLEGDWPKTSGENVTAWLNGHLGTNFIHLMRLNVDAAETYF